jgi:hypothetical protein
MPVLGSAPESWSMRPSRARFSGAVGAAAVIAVLLPGLAGCSSGGGQTTGAGSSTGPTSSATGSATSTSSSTTSSSTQASVKAVPVESNPPGDIPDNLAFVAYSNAAGHYAFTHPEGWAQTGAGTRVRFTDKLNGVEADSTAATATPTVSSAKTTEVPKLQQSVPAFALRSVTAVRLPGGSGVRIIFRRNSDPDPVTGRVYRDEVEEYLVYSAGHLVRMDLFGPVGADNVDAYRTMSKSLRIR